MNLAEVLPTNVQFYSRVIHYKHHYLWWFCCHSLKERDEKKLRYVKEHSTGRE